MAKKSFDSVHDAVDFARALLETNDCLYVFIARQFGRWEVRWAE